MEVTTEVSTPAAASVEMELKEEEVEEMLAAWGGSATSPAHLGARMRVRVRYDDHLPDLYLWDKETSRNLLMGEVLPNIHGYIIFKNWHLCGLCWDKCERENLHLPNSRDVVATITGLLKTS